MEGEERDMERERNGEDGRGNEWEGGEWEGRERRGMPPPL